MCLGEADLVGGRQPLRGVEEDFAREGINREGRNEQQEVARQRSADILPGVMTENDDSPVGSGRRKPARRTSEGG